MVTPEKLYQQYKTEIADVISTFPTDTSDDKVDAWIKILQSKLCEGKSGVFTMEFGQILRKEVSEMVKFSRATKIEESGPIAEKGEVFNPAEWVTIKVFRIHYKGFKRNVDRYNRSLQTPFIFKAIDP